MIGCPSTSRYFPLSPIFLTKKDRKILFFLGRTKNISYCNTTYYSFLDRQNFAGLGTLNRVIGSGEMSSLDSMAKP